MADESKKRLTKLQKKASKIQDGNQAKLVEEILKVLDQIEHEEKLEKRAS